ncbi:butyrophilin subfamily 3 member A2-like isoform X2 [Lepidochelys kempii]|uniref:butyrophilin subfamily 3 member A2-like isoform X2 n=1 Tax=Lepidochelys kempii TaxID=8472 RepID=UPI003C70073C
MLGARRPHCSAALLSAILLLHVQAAATVSFQVLVPAGPLSAPLGGTVLLPCHLSPALSAQAMQVKWSRPQLGQDVHVYLPDGSEVQGERYRGRAELLRDGIQSGSLALRIWNLTLRDEGHYLCDFQSDTYFSVAALELRLMNSGSDPLLHVSVYKDKGVSVTCLSAGWYPEPNVLWRNSHKKILSPESEQKLRSDNGLFNVSSTMVMTKSSDPALTCALSPGLPGPEKVSAIFISDTFFPRVSSWRVPLYLILTICVCFLPLASLYLWRIHKEKGAMYTLLKGSHGRPSWKEAFLKAADVTLDPRTAHPSLELSADRKSLKNIDSDQWTVAPLESMGPDPQLGTISVTPLESASL